MNKRFLIAIISLFVLFVSTKAQMKKPQEWIDYEKTFGVTEGLRHYDYNVIQIASSVPANVFWPGDKITFEFQLQNNTDNLIETDAQISVIQYGTVGIKNDIWLPKIVKLDYEKVIPKKIRIDPKSSTNVSVTIDDIKQYGGYALIFDLGKNGRRLGTSFAYGMKPNTVKMQYPKQSLDDLGVDFLGRVGVQAIRMGVSYTPTTYPNYRQKMQELDATMKKYMDNNITILAMIEEGSTLMPLGTPRSHLDDKGVFLRTKQDYAWLPSMDADLKQFIKNLCLKYGWPKGPITAISLWNEPWEGSSISGWQADMIRYREIYTKIAEAVVETRREGADVLVGGGDSNSNALDKFFADGSQDMLPFFDFVSIHYQGMESPVLYPEWNQRKTNKGRVLIWDTESWVGNTDDRIGLVVAANRSAGYDRSMGIYGGYLHSPAIRASWSASAAMCAVQTMIGEREFKELLFKNGLPWVMVFDGYEQNPDDGTMVIAGDLGEAFGKDNLLFRNVNLSADAKMKIRAQSTFQLFDFYGNKIEPENNLYEIPLTYKGYYLRTNGQKGSFAKLIAAVKEGKIEGYSPVEIIAKDFTRRITEKPELELVLTNILNRPVKGNLQVSIDQTDTSAPKEISLKPHETKTVKIAFTGGKENPDNTYPLKVLFDAGKDGIATHEENMHVNLIEKRSILVDGNLEDWNGSIPQIIKGSSEASISLTEAAWYPYMKFDTNASGLAQAHLAYDDDYFYFAAKVADKTPNKGAPRFETLDEDQFFYPDTAYKQTIYAMQSVITTQEANPSDTKALQHPTQAGRIISYFENTKTTQSIGMDMDLPVDVLTKTSLYFPNIVQHGVSVTVYDRETGKELCTQKIDKLWNGVYLNLLLSGKIRIRCSAYGWWYTAKLAGIFFDKTTEPAFGKTAANVTGTDFDATGDWKGKYGSEGYYIAGIDVHLPAEINCAPVSEDDLVALPWPEGVRHFTYRRNPTLPDGNSGERFDNILIAFNVLPIGKDGMEAQARGTMPKYVGYKCTDYEYALNTVAPEYGGGFEIWRMLTPGMPRKHFYPRQPKSPFDGPVKEGKLVTKRDGNTLYTECAIPWAEIPDVKKAIDNGEKIKFSFRVNDDGAGACMELARNRSVSKKNSRAFHPDWKEHWANEVEFEVEK